MRRLLSTEYIPFGSQYYRAPSPAPEDWESDLKNFANLGFNMMKFWVQWRWNHSAEDEFYFDDIDRLMDIAHHNKLKVMLNTIFDVAPAWIYKRYPDASMVTLDGRRIGPQTQPHRQIGGLGLCFNHTEAMEHCFRFLRETIKRYKDHPALEMWNVGSEPELTSSMAEMRLYADNAEKMGDMLCYCERCQRAFKEWLGTKYGSIDQLNSAWNRNYRSFDDAEVPRTHNTFNDMIDWRMFFVHTLGENVKRRFEVAKEEDRGKHPLMCHHVFIQGFPVTSTANDPWRVGQFGDLHGITQMDDPMMVDVARSCAKGKPVMCAEMLMLFGYTLDLPKPIDINDIKRFVFTGIAANIKGCIFWQYRPEILGREAPAWGLTYLDGSPTPWLQSFAEVNRVVQKNAAFLLDAAPQKAEIALLYNPENQIFAWAATGNEKTATHSLLGAHKALYRRNFKIDLIHPNYGPLEWNAIGDPHATAIIYRAHVRQHRSIGLDVTTRVNMSADEFREQFRQIELFRPVLDFAEIWFQQWNGTTFHDPLAAATIFDDQICTFQRGTVEVELIGEKSQGMLFWQAGGAQAKHEIALEVNSARFFEHFFSVFP